MRKKMTVAREKSNGGNRGQAKRMTRTGLHGIIIGSKEDKGGKEGGVSGEEFELRQSEYGSISQKPTYQ